MEWTTDNREWYRRIYLHSEHWKTLRSRKLEQNPTCEMCGRNSRLDVHHVNYRNLFDVTLGDLLTVCRSCHDEIHKMVPTPKREKPEFQQPVPRMSKRHQRRLANRCGYASSTSPADVFSGATFMIFAGKCFLCSSMLGHNFSRTKVNGAPKKWRHGVAVCESCASHKLTPEETGLALKFIGTVSKEDEVKAFQTAQFERSFITS